ncbi:MAG: CDP-alcohol phosphatidyltransferase [Deltaproteobacteria bacterium]|jgi:phosphatidylserine synthase|nr:CDP-alcohol phosphatidyltransferase [Deltaproteobacteria bacterium]|tara:strand:- start:1266 stop:2762 length:1497 start_codon:yes stop_codon:yes gene_type:complete
MQKREFLSTQAALVLVYGRPPLVFAGMVFALMVLLSRQPIFYVAGVVCLLVAMVFDLMDGWFAARFRPQAKLAHLADRIMDKAVYSMVFPLVAVGMMWRYQFLPDGADRQLEMLHVVFVLVLCVTVLLRDNFAHFMRNFSLRHGEEEELKEVTRLRTMVAAPVGAILYAHAFYVPEGPGSGLYAWISPLGEIPIQQLFFLEILFLIINFGSLAGYCRKYGTACLDDLCLGDEVLRRRILSVFPNALTVMNAVMGVLAMLFAYRGRVQEAYLILLGAGFFDRLDGALARKLGLTEPLPSAKPKQHNITFGGVLDDVSDTVSFCIAPAVIFYLLMAQVPEEHTAGLPYAWMAGLYALLGITRLVFFILDQNSIPGFFKGMPVPAAALLTTAPLIMLSQSLAAKAATLAFWSSFCFWLMLAGSLLMIAFPIRYLHIGRLMGRKPWVGRMTLLLIFGFAFTPYFGHVALAYLLFYTFSPLFTWRISPEIADQETRPTVVSNG